MEVLIRKRLFPALKKAVSDFVRNDGTERFLLKSPGAFRTGGIPAHYIAVSLADSKTEKRVYDVLAYGEAAVLDGENRLWVEICVKNNEAAGRMLLDAVKKEAGRFGAAVAISSPLKDDEILLKEDFKCFQTDFLMELNGTSDTSGRRVQGSDIRKHEYESAKKDLGKDAPAARIAREGQGSEIKCFVASEDGSVICSCNLSEYESSVCISDVFTEEGFRRQGYASYLVGTLAGEAVRSGKKAMLHVSGSNKSAVSLYKKLGFSVKDSLFSYIYPNDI